MKLQETLKDYKFYAEIDRENYGIFLNKGENISYGFIIRFTDLESVKHSLLKLEKPYVLKATPVRFSYRGKEESYAILKEEFFSDFDVERVKRENKLIDYIVENAKEKIKKRENLDIKETEVENTELPEDIKKAVKLSERKNIYLNVILHESEKFNLNLIADRKNLYYRIYAKERPKRLRDYDFYTINDRLYLVAPVRSGESFESIKENIKSLY